MHRILLVFLFCCNLSFAQNFPITWGPLERTNGGLLDILPGNQLDYKTLCWSGGNAFGSFHLVSYENLTVLNNQRLKLVTETGLCNFLDAFSVGNQTLVFLSDRMNSNMLLYVQTYDEELSLVSTNFVAEYQNANFGAKPAFQIIQSKNRKFIGVIWQIEGKGTQSDLYGYQILNESLEVLQKGEYTLPFDGNMSTINEHHLSNTGDYFIALTEHNKANDRIFTRSFENFKAIHVYKASNNELKEFSIDLHGKRLDDTQMSSNDLGAFTLTGIYGSGNRNGIEGIFNIQIDPNDHTLNSETFIPFGQEIVQEAWSMRQQDRSNSNFNSTGNIGFNNNGSFYNQSNFEPQLYNYRLRDFYTLEDGSMVGSLEQYYVYQRMNYDARTSMSTSMYYYYYDHIIAFRISKDGQLIWQKRIPKSQVSINDNGELSSYCSFQSEKSLNFIFNDHARNYDEGGLFNKDVNSIYTFNASRKNSTVAMVKIDLETGNVLREVMTNASEINSIVVPKLFKVDYSNKNILLYSISGSKERFGILNYK